MPKAPASPAKRKPPQAPAPSVKELERLMAKGGVQLRASERDLLWQFHQLLRDADAKLNLTRIRAFDAMVEKHYIDSMLAGYYVDLKGRVMDLGSGGGFPGIPLAIRHPGVQFVLVEGRRLRAGFLMNVQRALGLNNVEVVARKLNPDDEISVDAVITRAFSAIPETLSRIDRSVIAGGRAIFMKGPNCDDEISEAHNAFADWRLIDDIHYILPFSRAQRRLVVMQKQAGRDVGRHPEPPIAAGEREIITSNDNPRIKAWKKLHVAKGIRKEQRALLCGEKFIRELATQFPEAIEALVLTEDMASPPELHGFPVVVSRSVMTELDPVSGQGPVAIVRTPPLSPWSGALQAPGVTLFIPSQLPENVGALLRTADALGITDIVLLEEAAHPFLPKALRASGPAAWRVNLFRGPDLATLADSKLPLVALDTSGKDIAAFADSAPAQLGLVLGLEGPGTMALGAEIPRITIPTRTGTDSLNSAVAAGIAMYMLAPDTTDHLR